MKAVRGVSINTARHWLHHKGFCFIKHWKALYFDRHEWSDVVEYWQCVFIPLMKEHRQWIVEYVVGDAEKEKRKMVENYVECRIVLVAHNCQGHSTPSAPSHWGQRGYYPGSKF